MKTILCYGDSLTWGYNAEGPSRHAYEDRWPSVLQAELGAGVRSSPKGSTAAPPPMTIISPTATATARASCRRSSTTHYAARSRRHHARRQRHEALHLRRCLWRAGRAWSGWSNSCRCHAYGFDAPAPQVLIVVAAGRSARPPNAGLRGHVCRRRRPNRKRLARSLQDCRRTRRLRLLRRRHGGEDHAARRRPSRRREHAGDRQGARAGRARAARHSDHGDTAMADPTTSSSSAPAPAATSRPSAPRSSA